MPKKLGMCSFVCKSLIILLSFFVLLIETNYNQMNNSTSHISISCVDIFPDVGLQEIKKNLEKDGLSINLEMRPISMYASMEWIIPTAIYVFCAKSYFDAFLKEAGKDHYHILKSGVKKLADKIKEIPMLKVASKDSTEKVNQGYSQSSGFSIIVKTKNNRTLKLLFDNNLTKEDWEDAIDQFFDYVIQNYETAPNDKLTGKMQELKQNEAFWIYAIIDPKTKQLAFHDDMTLHVLEKNNK